MLRFMWDTFDIVRVEKHNISVYLASISFISKGGGKNAPVIEALQEHKTVK